MFCLRFFVVLALGFHHTQDGNIFAGSSAVCAQQFIVIVYVNVLVFIGKTERMIIKIAYTFSHNDTQQRKYAWRIEALKVARTMAGSGWMEPAESRQCTHKSDNMDVGENGLRSKGEQIQIQKRNERKNQSQLQIFIFILGSVVSRRTFLLLNQLFKNFNSTGHFIRMKSESSSSSICRIRIDLLKFSLRLCRLAWVWMFVCIPARDNFEEP